MAQDKLDDSFRAADLIAKFLRGTITIEESDELDAWLEASDANKAFFQDLCNARLEYETLPYLEAVDTKKGWKDISGKTGKDNMTGMPFRKRYNKPLSYAAVLLLLIGIPLGIALYHKHNAPTEMALQNILPGSNMAMLSTADGQEIVLNGTVTKNITAGIAIQKDTGLVYSANSHDYRDNRLTVPLKCSFSLRLQDGTRVWLNAGSSLSFPVAFSGRERRVVLTGEGYFQVAHNAAMPFRVYCRNSVTEAVGTAFDVNGYTDSVTTTLVQGIMTVSNGSHTVRIMLGHRVAVHADAAPLRSRAVDTAPAQAWKNRDFVFHRTPITAVMEEAARWYGCEVAYAAGYDRAKAFTGEIKRDVSLQEFLQLLETTGMAKCQLEGQTVVLSPFP